MCEHDPDAHIVSSAILSGRQQPFGEGDDSHLCGGTQFTPFSWAMHLFMRAGMTGREAVETLSPYYEELDHLPILTLAEWISQGEGIPHDMMIAITHQQFRHK